MGLLTSEHSRNRLVTLLEKHNLKLSVLAYISGLAWFLALAYQPLNAGTYFSENALLPGLVETELPKVLRSAVQYKDDVDAELKKDIKVTPQKWVFEKFRELGLETFQQNFSVVYPFTSLSSKVVVGENVYAILRARRAASTEAIVLSVPLRPMANKAKLATGGGIALALGLAKEFKRKPYWSKDIIFLFSDYDEIGTMAWLDGYHQTESQYILTKDLEGRSGQIQAAVNLELPLENVNYYNIRLEGLNGQLPNLDLVNLVVRLCHREGARVTIHHLGEAKKAVYSDSNGESFKEYKMALGTMLRMMWYQASGAPSGNHGLFHKFHIESLTLQGITKKKGSLHDITSTAKIIEGVFRSLNNLLERFHQSFFFYLLPSTKRYVSIGMYMPPFGLMALAGLIKGITLWVGAEQTSKEKKEEDESKEKKQEGEKTEGSGATSEQDTNNDDKEKEKESLLKKKEEATARKESEVQGSAEKATGDSGASDVKHDEEEDEELLVMEPPSNKGVMTIIPVILVCMLLGWMAHQGPELLTRIMPRFRIHTEDMVMYSMLAIFTAALMYPRLMTKKSNHPNMFLLDWQLLKSVALISQTLALASIAILNISQAFFLTAFMVPVTTLVRPAKTRLFRWFQMFMLVLISPLSLMYLVGLISAPAQSSMFAHLLEGYTVGKELMFLGVMDSYLFNAWTETIITAVIFPIWLLFWAIPWVGPS